MYEGKIAVLSDKNKDEEGEHATEDDGEGMNSRGGMYNGRGRPKKVARKERKKTTVERIVNAELRGAGGKHHNKRKKAGRRVATHISRSSLQYLRDELKAEIWTMQQTKWRMETHLETARRALPHYYG